MFRTGQRLDRKYATRQGSHLEGQGIRSWAGAGSNVDKHAVVALDFMNIDTEILATATAAQVG